MPHNLIPRPYKIVCLLLALSAFALNANAQPLDEVSLDYFRSLEYQNQIVVATIRFTGPVHYLRHFPTKRGKTLEIFYNRVPDATNTETWVDNQTIKSSPSKLISDFTVTSRDQSTKPKLVVEFARETQFSVVAGKDRRSFVITMRPEKPSAGENQLQFLPTIKPEVKQGTGVTSKSGRAAAAKINKEAHALLVQARKALAARNNVLAVGVLNKLLLLPPNGYTQEGLEWIGVARERAGQIDKAKGEYSLYLKLYPKGAGAARVKQHLAGLGRRSSKTSPMAAAATAIEKQQAPVMTTFGGVSSRYYYGHSNTSGSIIENGVPTTTSQSQTDQSMLITSIDANLRYRTENSESRLVFRDVDTQNFLANQPSRNQVYAAYGEIKGRKDNYLIRVGRQSSTGAGVLGRFDGINGSYGDAQDMRVNAVAGKLAEYSQVVEPRFFGASVDRGAFSIYGINQTVDGTLDRRALGTEFRYFDTQKNAFGSLEYDINFKEVNAVQIMGTTRGTSLLPDSTLTFMLDHRKTPSLSIRNALNGATVLSIKELLQTKSESELRDLALARTSISNSGQIGITHPFRTKWQIGGDFRLTSQTGLPSSGTPTPTTGPNAGIPTPEGFIQAIPGRGLEKSVTGQVIGSSLYKPGDVWSGSLTLSTSDLVNGNSFFFYNHTQINRFWMTDVTLQISSFKDQFGTQTKQLMPLLRGSYRFRERFTIDADLGYQKIDFSGPQGSSTTTRFFTSAGGRWDF